MPTLPPSLLHRPDVRLAAFGLSAVAAVYFGFIGLGVAAAGTVVKGYGYHVLLLTFALWLAALWRLWREAGPPDAPVTRREILGAALGVGAFTLMAVTAEPFRSKVLFDEFVLQSTAYNMHYFRDNATMVRGYDILGVFLSTDSYLDKRPAFYPLLVSLTHDLSGYRPLNAYWLNALLMPVALGLAYYLGRRLGGWRAGAVALGLFGSLPLLGQNATGSGMELLNFTMILAVAALGGAYLRKPDGTRLTALVLGAVLLAQSRYESALYVLPVALMIMTGWWKQGRVVLSWPAIASPLMLVPCALQNKVLNHTRWMWELKESQESRFSTDYLPKNLHGAAEFLFSTTSRYANSPILAVLGLLALGWLLWRVLRQPPRLRESSDPLALALIGAAALANTALVMFYYWSSFDDPMASRFSLPFHIVLVFAVVAASVALIRRMPSFAVVVGLVCLAAVAGATSRFAQTLYSHTGIDEIEWEKRFVATRPPGERLIITNKSTLPWLLLKTPSILIGRARLVADRVEYQIREGTFREILVTQSFRPTTSDGDHAMQPEDRLPSYFKLEPLAERRFGTKLTRISRLLAVDLPADFKPSGETAARP